jgi:hypothetical protein
MTDLLDVFKSSMTDEILDQLGSQVGIRDKAKAGTAASGAFTVLLDALQRNAVKEEGISSLDKALEKDHDGSVLDNLMGYIGGQGNFSDRTTNGAGILNHVLGNKQSGVIEMLSKVAGLDKSTSGELLIKMAPIVMGALGKQKRAQNLDKGGIFDVLTKSVEPQRKDSQFGGLLNAVLDQDGDGDVKDDLLNMGMKALGGLFKRKR